MRRKAVLWGVFVSRFEDALARFRRRHLTAEEAGGLLGVTGRQFRRMLLRFDEAGAEGLRDRRVGRRSPRRASAAELSRMCDLYQERYSDFTVKHFHEALVGEHNYRLPSGTGQLRVLAGEIVTYPTAAAPSSSRARDHSRA